MLLSALVFVSASKVPLVMDEVLSVSAVCVDSVPHVQVCAMLVLSMLFVVVAEVRAESALEPAAQQPMQLETVNRH